ncbi:Arc family DNA-binding protein [Morganella morganii]|uniref:Arc family DNA-binding protein n=1 Tax=Morganella morganii TaxID=582 RepID=UPI001BDAFE3E|nr:Arc family DNA-binding protein [Morganella morganii]MBT0426007.1 Arc family DNA-binding protein [Morganella morganii subsp. morganii]MBT0473758.1 Arc family DNA-binding protein [Morganella morganii subsp. morganii]QWM01943.1 Arc family DNA-binding protein [Morganella morganii subsp. morganii]
MSRVRDIIPYSLRMPDDLKTLLAERAKQNGRSLNSEMVMILQDAVNSASPQPKSSAEHTAAIQAEEVKKMVFDTLVKLYEKDDK